MLCTIHGLSVKAIKTTRLACYSDPDWPMPTAGMVLSLLWLVGRSAHRWENLPTVTMMIELERNPLDFEYIYHNCGALGSNKCLSRPLWPPNNSSWLRRPKIPFISYGKFLCLSPNYHPLVVYQPFLHILTNGAKRSSLISAPVMGIENIISEDLYNEIIYASN